MAIPNPEHRARRSRSALLAALVVFSTLAAVTGCTRKLFSDRDPRSQFDRYDAVRNQYAPAYIEDEFGRRTPNLRGRLLPKQ